MADPLRKLLASSRRVHPRAAERFLAQCRLRADTGQFAALPEVVTLGEPPASSTQTLPASSPTALREVNPPAVFLGNAVPGGDAESWQPALAGNAFAVIAGSSGSGKSELLKRVCAELAKADVRVLLLDFHGDLLLPGIRRLQLGADLGLSLFRSSQIGGEVVSQDVLVVLLRQAIPGLGHLQLAMLRQALVELRRRGSQDLADLRALIDARVSADRATAGGLLAAMEEVFGEPVFRARKKLDAAFIFERSTVLDLSSLGRPGQVVQAGLVLHSAFAAVQAGGPVHTPCALRLFLGLDEAAVLADDPNLTVLAKEARKFGLGMAVASQELSDMPRSLLNNASTVALFRINDRSEAVLAARLLPDVRPEQFQRLSVPGECFFRDGRGVRRLRVARAEVET